MGERSDKNRVEAIKAEMRAEQERESALKAEAVAALLTKPKSKEKIFAYIHTAVVEGMENIKQQYPSIVEMAHLLPAPEATQESLDFVEEYEMKKAEEAGTLNDFLEKLDSEEEEDVFREQIGALEAAGERDFIPQLYTEKAITEFRTHAMLTKIHLGTAEKTIDWYGKAFCARLISELAAYEIPIPEELEHFATRPHSEAALKEKAELKKIKIEVEKRLNLNPVNDPATAESDRQWRLQSAERAELEKFLETYPDPRAFIEKLLGDKTKKKRPAN
ncbi:MAG TPA: hypothetical protein VJA27_03985 [Patescibacteria group bacterium]|nr:hypothetical protein [Patescibacteria group bacterium]